MFGFLRRKKPAAPPVVVVPADPAVAEVAVPPSADVALKVAPEADQNKTAGQAGELTRADTAAPIESMPPTAMPRPADASTIAPVAPPSGTTTLPPAQSHTQPLQPAQPQAQAQPQLQTQIQPQIQPQTPAQSQTQPPTLATAQPEPEPAGQAAPRKSWMTRLRQGLTKTRANLAGMLGLIKIDENLYEELETALLTSDTGYAATERILAQLRSAVNEQRLTDGSQVKVALREIIAGHLKPLEAPIDIDRATPLVLMIAGVNGAGKTTSIGKLTHHLQREGKSILLAAGDTFRAAAREQLATWGARNDVQVISQHGGDPGAVAFDAVSSGIARRTGVVMIDTAGRLPTQTNLMEELKKIKRSVAKAMPDAPHEVLLVLDGNTGQNMLNQVKAFDEAVGLTGLIVTKLDGTAKGGALVGLAHERRAKPIPVYFIGVGETIDDLQAFSASEFADALVG